MSNKIRAKRKHDPKRKLAKFVKSRASKVYCWDGKCYPEMQFDGDPLKSSLPRHIKKQVMYSVGDDVHHWNIMLLIFERYRDGKTDVITDILSEKVAASNDLNAALDGDLERRVASRNPKHVVCWAWFAVPLKNADLASMRDGIIETLVHDGAFDELHCIETNKTRLMIEKLEKVS